MAYDRDGLLTQAGDLTLSHDGENGLLVGTTVGGVSDTYSYNDHGEVTSYSAQGLYSYTLTRDNLGRITGRNEVIGGESYTYSYEYDDAGRLVAATTNGNTVSYTYDANGNRLSRIQGPKHGNRHL